MKVNRKKLVEALEKVMPALGKTDVVPVLQCVRFGKTRVVATDGEIVIATQMHREANPGLDCYVPAIQLVALLHSIVDDEVVVEQKKEIVYIRSSKGKIKGKFTTVKCEEHIAIPELGVEDQKEKLSVFLDAINFCRFNVSRDDADGQYCGVRLDGKRVMSTDKYRLSKYDLDEAVVAEPCTVPVEFINLLLKYREGVKNLRLEDGKLIATLEDGTVMYSTLLAGEYKNLDDMFPDGDTKFEYVEFPDALKPVLDRHINFLKSVGAADRYIEVSVSGTTCTIISKDKEHGELEEQLELSAACDGSFGFHVNPAFWREVCSICNAFNYHDGMILFLTDRLSYLCREAVEVG